MKIEGPVVQVGGSHHSYLVVRYEVFGMDETWSELIDPDSCSKKRLIVGPGHFKDAFLVWIVGSNDPYIHSTLCSNLQRSLHRLIQNKVWSCDPDIFPSAVDYLEIGVFSNGGSIERTVVKGLYKAICPTLYSRQESIQVIPLPSQAVPVT